MATRKAAKNLVDLLSINMVELDDLCHHSIFYRRSPITRPDRIRGAREISNLNDPPEAPLTRDGQTVCLERSEEGTICFVNGYWDWGVDRNLLPSERLGDDDILLLETSDKLDDRFKLLVVNLKIHSGTRGESRAALDEAPGELLRDRSVAVSGRSLTPTLTPAAGTPAAGTTAAGTTAAPTRT